MHPCMLDEAQRQSKKATDAKYLNEVVSSLDKIHESTHKATLAVISCSDVQERREMAAVLWTETNNALDVVFETVKSLRERCAEKCHIDQLVYALSDNLFDYATVKALTHNATVPGYTVTSEEVADSLYYTLCRLYHEVTGGNVGGKLYEYLVDAKRNVRFSDFDTCIKMLLEQEMYVSVDRDLDLPSGMQVTAHDIAKIVDETWGVEAPMVRSFIRCEYIPTYRAGTKK